MSAEKITVHSLPDLKNTSDDALVLYLTSLRFKQDHFLTDVRLALSAAAALIGGATFYFDWKLGFAATKTATTYAVIVYFIINGILTFWIWAVEKGTVYVGSRKGYGKLVLTSLSEKHAPIYGLDVVYTAPGSSLQQKTRIAAPFNRWFAEDGTMVKEPFRQWLATEIRAIGEADPATLKTAERSRVGDGSRNPRIEEVEDEGEQEEAVIVRPTTKAKNRKGKA